MPVGLSPVGITFRDAVPGHTHYIDTAQVVLQEGATQLAPAGGASSPVDQIYHRLDAGATSVVWLFDDFSLPLNLGSSGSGGSARVRYAISNTEYDLSDSSDRNAVGALLSSYMTEAEMRNEPKAVGRFRYLQFELSFGVGETPVLYESSFTQHICASRQSFVPIAIDINGEALTYSSRTYRLETVQGQTLDLQVTFSLGGLPYSLDGATVKFRANRYGAPPTPVTLDIMDITGSVVDADDGIALITIPPEATQSLRGSYLAMIELQEASGSIRRFLIDLFVKPAI